MPIASATSIAPAAAPDLHQTTDRTGARSVRVEEGVSSAGVVLTRHARQRCAQRNLSPRDIDYVVTHGARVHRTGALFYVLRRRDLLPAHRGQDAYVRLVGVILIVHGDVVCTVYRNRKSYRHVCKKLKYRLVDSQEDEP